MELFEYFIKVLPAISTVISLAVFILMLMARDKFVSKKDHEKLETKTALIKERLIATEAALENVPRTDAMHELALSIERMNGSIKGMSSQLVSMEKFSKRMDVTIARQEEFLLNFSRGK